MRRFVVGTAGHVDHGKTTLVKALTGVDTDRLPEEKRRGITIELGFARWELDPGTRVSVVDVPGHRRLVHAMIAGAVGIELVLLVVAADEGVMAQTREHVAVCELLGIRRAVVAVTKADRVPADLAEVAKEEAMELLAGRFEAEAVVCSAKTGEGLEALGAALRRALASLPRPGGGARPRLAVDRVFSVRGAGTVVTGTLVEGSLEVGAPLFVVGEQDRLKSAARGLHVHDAAVERAEAPTRLAINLAGLSTEEVRRGDLVTTDPAVFPTRRIDVLLRPSLPLKRGRTAQLHVGTARTSARIEPLAPVLEPGEPEAAREAGQGEPAVLARLRLDRPLAIAPGDRFVLRGPESARPEGAVLGGGRVLDVGPPLRRRREARVRALRALASEPPSLRDAIEALVQEAAPRALPGAELVRRLAASGAAIERALGELAGARRIALAKGAALSPVALEALARSAREMVAAHHATAPLDRGLPVETLRSRLSSKSDPLAAEEALRLAVRPAPGAEPLVVDGDVVRNAGFGGAPSAGAAGDALARLRAALEGAGLKGMTEHGAGEAAGQSGKALRATLARLARDGDALHLGELWFPSRAVLDLRGRVAAWLADRPRMSVADFKILSGLGRKQAIPLLEHLDREGLTRRDGDDRVPGPAARV